ncbi:hypothetical protein BMF94_3233 [Rhodotorula taiwanensis]|uniref:Transglycosylase SLT domain-containing protein n=1 Tax=Rhodotorula taiwanensis TaxID=741276 RepID=A0A2S5BAA3_9BASI|nr:hypothetical protein BMF94_3233 [Rhodotorula taiwanensis]
MTRRYDRFHSSDSDDSDGSDDRERRDSSNADTDDGDVRDPRKTRTTSRKAGGNVFLLGVVFFLAIAACLGLAWYNFSPSAAAASSATSSPEAVSPTSAPEEVEAGLISASTPDQSEASSPPSSASQKSSPTSSPISKQSSPSAQSTSTAKPAPAGEGLVGYVDEKCGPSGAVAKSTKDKGPNGSEDWLNCGLSKDEPDAPWTPPSIKLDQVKTISLEVALAMDNSAYKACTKHVSLFEKYAEAYEVPPILLAAFAMQENHGSIKTGAAYFSQVLKEHDGSLLLAMGTYNGWYAGLTYNKATAARHTSCCECQNNLDYHHSMLNGWLLGLDGSQMGTIRNIECS